MGNEKVVDEVTHKCEICGVSLGESNNVLYVEGRWMHYQCAFRQSVERASTEVNSEKDEKILSQDDCPLC